MLCLYLYCLNTYSNKIIIVNIENLEKNKPINIIISRSREP